MTGGRGGRSGNGGDDWPYVLGLAWMACASLSGVELDGDRKGGYDERTLELASG